MLDEFLHKQLRLPYNLRAKTLRKVENPRAVVIFVHGIASSVEMWTQAEQFVKGDYNVFAVDLLGHGQSPKPDWSGAQNLQTQARALHLSILKLKKLGLPLFLIGHSMGSLVVAEYLKKNPRSVNGACLLSPPIYSPDEAKDSLQESALKRNYQKIIKNPENSIKFVNGVISAGMVSVDKFNSQAEFEPIRQALDEAILNQDTFNVLARAEETPIKIIYGAFDPVVIGANIRKLGRMNPWIRTTRVLASHDPTKEMLTIVSRDIKLLLKEKKWAKKLF